MISESRSMTFDFTGPSGLVNAEAAADEMSSAMILKPSAPGSKRAAV